MILKLHGDGEAGAEQGCWGQPREGAVGQPGMHRVLSMQRVHRLVRSDHHDRQLDKGEKVPPEWFLCLLPLL